MTVDFGCEILIPTGDVGDFAVVACDQYSAQPEYWERLGREMPSGSALEFILPECYLGEARERIAKIRKNAAALISSGRFNAVNGAVAVTRTTARGRVRRGIVAAIDLDDYDYKPGNSALIRASERTIEQRIPPRVAIREAIDIELPHIMLLVDDRDGLLQAAVDRAEKRTLYDGELRGGGGHIKGELISSGGCAELDEAAVRITELSLEKFGTRLFALVGDGNHSLATAKYCRAHKPTANNGKALVEIVNIYDPGLVFEPIHRLVQTDDRSGFLSAFARETDGGALSQAYAPEPHDIRLPEDVTEAIKRVDAFCERYVTEHGGSIEYVHGDDALRRPGCVGIRMHGIGKSELFGAVIRNGVLPKKTFSLGEADEKRFYVEARKIV